ncbi:MAG TPA: hypothetical protein VIL74_09630 [Pyrinomonadaceae bacterium]|jgi:hypothetical protein
MNPFRALNYRLTLFFLLLVIFCCAPVWAVEYFVNQDGSAHVYSSFIILELVKGNPRLAETFAFNSISVPNSSGHWLMAALLAFFSPFLVTKIMATLTFAAFVALIGWLRYKTVGIDGVKTSFLLGAAIGFNWLWLCGFYNFLIGVACFVFGLGLFFGWNCALNARRASLLAVLFLLAYFSHIISFAVLSGSILLLLFAAPRENLKSNLLYFAAALLPIVPLLVVYKSVSASGGGFYPVWRNLENPFSPVDWLQQMRTADPFIFISRKAFPFVDGTSGFFAAFAPLLWIGAGFVLLAVATFREAGAPFFRGRTNLIFLLLLTGSVSAAMLAPDDFGLSNGSILRERLLICGLVFAVPLFRGRNSPRLKRLAQFALLVVVLFQTAALWDYALRADAQAREFLSARRALRSGDRLASVVIVENGGRFNSTPATMLNNYFGIAENRLVWDNYEIGHYLFPVVAKNPADKRFVFEWTRSNAFALHDRGGNFEGKLSQLESCLRENQDKIDALIVYGNDVPVEKILNNWFVPVYENGRVRVFRPRNRA